MWSEVTDAPQDRPRHRCSPRERSVPLVVLAFLTDPEVVERILRHLGLPMAGPVVARAELIPPWPIVTSGWGSQASGEGQGVERGPGALGVPATPQSGARFLSARSWSGNNRGNERGSRVPIRLF